MYRGTIIENSLADKSILASLTISNTRNAGDWVLHDVEVSEQQARSLGKYLDVGPWYVHFWKPGKDEVIVVYKTRTFTICHSDKSTWTDALEHGKSIGIPEEQLDFLIN